MQNAGFNCYSRLFDPGAASKAMAGSRWAVPHATLHSAIIEADILLVRYEMQL